MAIKIIKDNDISITESEYIEFRQKYDDNYRMWSGAIPTLEEFIKQQITKKIENT